VVQEEIGKLVVLALYALENGHEVRIVRSTVLLAESLKVVGGDSNSGQSLIVKSRKERAFGRCAF
jgi:hypothetical protein